MDEISCHYCNTVDQDTVSNVGVCPNCRHKGKRVGKATLQSMLSVSLRQLQNVDYFFCREADCPVVYFSADGAQTFTTHDLRERVFQKEPNSEDVFVCYCFRHSRHSIRLEWVETGQSTVVDDINAGIHAGQCACEWRNPQGVCCLGNVRQVVQAMEARLSTVALTE